LIWEASNTGDGHTFGVKTSAAPTAMYVYANSYSTAIANLLTSITTAATTAVTAVVVPTATNTPYVTNLDVTLENGGTANTLSIYFETAASAHVATLEPGSVCGWLP